MSLYCGAVFAAEPSSPERGGWFEMPLEASAEPRDGGDLYLVGGYNSIDAGTVPWGGIVESENLYVGDRAGEVVIVYEDGSRSFSAVRCGSAPIGSTAARPSRPTGPNPR